MSLVPALLALLPAATSAPALSPTIRLALHPLRIADIEQVEVESAWPQVPVARQVRIEQRITIRIAPRRPVQPPEAAFARSKRSNPPTLRERHMGKCVPVAAVAGVQVTTDNRLLLFLRDSRVVSASLERACRARDFYSGFYLERHSDGKLCVDRDTLLSRSGANCKLSRLRQLVEGDD